MVSILLGDIYLAYRMMTLLFETIFAFEEIWMECLGDIDRYRMANITAPAAMAGCLSLIANLRGLGYSIFYGIVSGL